MDPKDFLAELIGLLRECASMNHVGQRTDDLVKRIDELAQKLEDATKPPAIEETE